MFENPYRPCPMCRTQLQVSFDPKAKKDWIDFIAFRMKFGKVTPTWVGYTCPNCGSEIWIDPFARMREGKK